MHARNQTDDRITLSFLLVAVGVLAVGIATIIAVVRAAQPLHVPGLIVAVGEIVGIAIVVCLGLGAALWGLGRGWRSLTDAYAAVVGRLDRVERDHQKILAMLRRQAPAAAASALLIGNAVVLIADKAFEGNIAVTLATSVSLMLLFWIGSQLQAGKHRATVVIGWLIWLLAIALLPVGMMVLNGWDRAELLQFLSRFDLTTKLYWLVMVVVMALAPFLVRRAGGEAVG